MPMQLTRSSTYELAAGDIPRGPVLAAFLVSMAIAGLLRESYATVSLNAGITTVLTGHKLTWLCLGIAVWHLVQVNQSRLKTAELLAMTPAVMLTMTSWGSWPWLGIATSLLLLLRAAGPADTSARSGLSIGLILALHQGLVPILAGLAGDGLLAVDASIAQYLGGLFVPDLTREGTTIRSASGHAVVLVWGCSSLSQVGTVMLFCWSLCSLARPPGPSRPWKLTCLLVFVATATIAINTLRLSLLATSPGMFTHIHDSTGAVVFRLVFLGIAVIAAFVYSWSCRSDR